MTPSGDLGHWTFDDFATTVRTGQTPEGKVLDPSVMPWPIATRMTDVELEALWLYLQSLPTAAIAAVRTRPHVHGGRDGATMRPRGQHL